MTNKQQLKIVLQHYIIAALWSSNDDKEQPLDSKYSVGDISIAAFKQMKEDVEKFLKENKKVIKESKLSLEQVGHDFWLTRNHHGAGWFDRNLPKHIELSLEDASKKFKECNLYVGGDEKIHIM